MPQDRSDMDDEDRVCFDFDGTNFVESQIPLSGDPWGIVEVGFSPHQRGTTVQQITNFDSPKQLEAFLAHPMTELTDVEIARVEEINRIIVTTLHSCIDPIFSVYDPSDDFDPNVDCSGTYFDDTRMIFRSDILIANQVFKADGIGMVIHEASQHGIPVVSIVPASREITVLHDGLPGRIKEQLFYESDDELSSKLKQIISDIIPDLRVRSRQRIDDKEDWSNNVGRQLFQCRLTVGVTLETLSQQTGYAAEALNELECHPTAFFRPPHAMIQTIATELNCEAVIGNNGTRVRAHTTIDRPDFVKRSLTNLVDLVCENSTGEYSHNNDRAVIRAWSRYEEMICLAAATREHARPGAPEAYLEVVSQEDWQVSIDHFKTNFWIEK